MGSLHYTAGVQLAHLPQQQQVDEHCRGVGVAVDLCICMQGYRPLRNYICMLCMCMCMCMCICVCMSMHIHVRVVLLRAFFCASSCSICSPQQRRPRQARGHVRRT